MMRTVGLVGASGLGCEVTNPQAQLACLQSIMEATKSAIDVCKLLLDHLQSTVQL